MRIASITMVGQWPHGIPLHVRNMEWALTTEDHIFVVTLPKYISEFNLKNTSRVTYIPFLHEGTDNFVNFWGGFPQIIEEYKINPKYFLLMEEDIWFHKKIDRNFGPLEIPSYLPLISGRHSVTVGGKFYYHRVWEGGIVFSGTMVQTMLNLGVNFSFTNKFYFEDRREEYESRVGGKLGLKWFNKCDTMDDVTYFCALDSGCKLKHYDNAVHIRGPESLHRQFPELYFGPGNFGEAVKKLHYMDLYSACAAYYIAGNWSVLPDIKAKPETKAMFRKLSSAAEWMTSEELNRLNRVLI